jgi:asparagine synthase (glutamine-hydrolysing)
LSTLAEAAPWRQLAAAGRPLVELLREPRGGHAAIGRAKRFLRAAGLPRAQRWQRYLALADRAERRALYSPEIAANIDFDEVDRMGRQYFETAPAVDPLDRALYQDLKFYLPDDILALTDRMGMWHSLELRVPFLDHPFVEFCARIPSSLKIRRGEKKHLLRRAARPLLPAAVLDHRKQGFNSPMASWLRGSLRALAPGGGTATASGVLVPAEIERRIAAHHARRARNEKQIFSVLMFERWWQRHHHD